MKIFHSFILVLFLLSGCASNPVPIPVVNKSPDRVVPKAYKVHQGDSIYNISWAFGLDFLDIAEWNGLKSPYRLSEGQIVYLDQNGKAASATSTNTPEAVVITKLPTKSKTKPVAVRGAGESVNFSPSPNKWNWPAEGKLTGKFSPSNGSNGIQIAGVEGSPIKAAAGGEVVFTGIGLRGYGKLIIVKHSKEYISAYAHNKEIMVSEGQSIKASEQIATMGESDATSPMLHFEIRKKGVPIDPLPLLK